MSEIYTNLFLGNITTSRDEGFFKKNKIKNVLIAAKNLKRSFPPTTITYHQLPISDNPTTIILKHWPESMEFLTKSPGNSLVHCQGGKSRSASTVMAFVMFKEGISSSQSVAKVRKLHKFAYPNPGFLKQLEYWEDILAEYRKLIPLGAKNEDFGILIKITSQKLSEVTADILAPSQNMLKACAKQMGYQYQESEELLPEEPEESNETSSKEEAVHDSKTQLKGQQMNNKDHLQKGEEEEEEEEKKVNYE